MAADSSPRSVALLGNPNVGKTSLFNVLTGARHRVGNYAGVTVERLEGDVAARFAEGTSRPIRLVDMPGCYSLTATSADEAAAVELLDGRVGPRPAAVVVVVDATNLSRNLYMVLQARERDVPVVVALNMSDSAQALGMPADPQWLADRLGVPVVATSGRTGAGARELVLAIDRLGDTAVPGLVAPDASAAALREVLRAQGGDGARTRWVLCTAAAGSLAEAGGTAEEIAKVQAIGSQRVEAAAIELIALRYREVDRILATRPAGTSNAEAPAMAASERIDRWLTHRVWGLLAFMAVMATVFAAVFSGAEPFIGAIEQAVAALADAVSEALGPGILADLVTKGIISGVGNVLVFVPQIALLFALISALEDSGYLARAAFLMDRLMARLGLHGRAFIPLLSGYACAVPAILGTRTISSFKDRVVTILMIPYMSCSARLPIYGLVIGALLVTDGDGIDATWQRTAIMFGMYALSTCSALVVGFVAKRTILRSPTPPLVLELPPYRWPRPRNTALVVFDRTMDFVRNAGTVILACTIVLWALLSFPRDQTGAGGEGPTVIANSYGGKAAQLVEPVLEPIGQDWRMGIGIIGSFAAREVLVGTLGLVYGLESEDDDAPLLRDAIRNDIDDETGRPRHTPLSGVALMVFFVYACQCMSTLAAIRRETGSWRWTAFVFFSMTTVAYVAALVVYQGGRILGFG